MGEGLLKWMNKVTGSSSSSDSSSSSSSESSDSSKSKSESKDKSESAPVVTKPPAAGPPPGEKPDDSDSTQEGEHSAYGGKGPFHLPVEHKAGMQVPKGGASCSSCEYLGPENTCTEVHFVVWNGGDNQLPADPDSYCSDWYTPKGH